MVPRPKSEVESSTQDPKIPNQLGEEYWVPDGSLKLTSGFKKYPSKRDVFLKNAVVWMEGKRIDDDIGDLWRVHDKLYDLSNFIDEHPGGKFWLEVTRGTDVTESFMTSHFGPRPENTLKKFYVKEATHPRISPYTFKEDGFYMILKEKVWKILKEKGRGTTLQMYFIQDSMLALFIFFAALGSWQASLMYIFIASVFLSFAVATAHNFFHQKDNLHMYIYDLMMFSSREFRISHSISHHNFPNTIWDYEISGFEPNIECLSKKEKSFLQRYFSFIPVYWTFIHGLHFDVVKRYYLILIGKVKFHWSYTLIFIQLAFMALLSGSFLTGLWLWFVMHTSCNIVFLQNGFTTGHHHPDIWNEGDKHIHEKDFGLHQVIAVRDRGVVMNNLFLSAISFGNHALHHLFPTVDCSRLPMLLPALVETCKEFDVEFTLMTPWDLFRGFWDQIAKVQPNLNYTTLMKEPDKPKND